MGIGSRIRLSFLWLPVVSGVMVWPVSPAVAEFSFVPGHFYTANNTHDVIEYDANGTAVGSITLVSYPDALRGLTFGPDGFLYVTVARGNGGFSVLAVDRTGWVRASYVGQGFIGGDAASGKIAVDDESIYVAGSNGLTKFTRDGPSPGNVIYTNSPLVDVEVLPTGNLLVASRYGIEELTSAGNVVRVLPSRSYSDIMGIEFDRVRNKIFVTHLGTSGFFFRLMRVDGPTGILEDDVVFTYANDIFLTANHDLLVGSGTEPPRLYSRELMQIAALAGGEREFVTQYPLADQRVGIGLSKFAVVDKLATASKAKMSFVGEDEGIAKGWGVDAGEIEAAFTVTYALGSVAGSFVLPLGDAGWRENSPVRAVFENDSAPAGSTQARRSVIRPGTKVKLVGRGLGDTPLDIVGAGEPNDSVFAAYCVTNAGNTICMCSKFPQCSYKPIAASTGAKLVCRRGVSNPTCTAIVP